MNEREERKEPEMSETRKDETRYGIRVTRHYYGSQKDTTRWYHTDAGRVWTGTRREARLLIEHLDYADYCLGHNEHSTPTYRIVCLGGSHVARGGR